MAGQGAGFDAGGDAAGINPVHDNLTPRAGAVYSYRVDGVGAWSYEATLKACKEFSDEIKEAPDGQILFTLPDGVNVASIPIC